MLSVVLQTCVMSAQSVVQNKAESASRAAVEAETCINCFPATLLTLWHAAGLLPALLFLSGHLFFLFRSLP
jgi:hypothetical protein